MPAAADATGALVAVVVVVLLLLLLLLLLTGAAEVEVFRFGLLIEIVIGNYLFYCVKSDTVDVNIS